MLTLIKREIADMSIFYLITAIFMLILAGVLVYNVVIGWENKPAMGVPSMMYTTLGSFPGVFI